MTHHHKTRGCLRLAIGWPVHPELRFEESANGARCFSRLARDLEAHFQAPKACPATVSRQALARPHGMAAAAQVPSPRVYYLGTMAVSERSVSDPARGLTGASPAA